MKIIIFVVLLSVSLLGNVDISKVWTDYKNRFIAKDGRVVDIYNDNISHTEGVGYALYLSYKMDDVKSFQKVYKWYKENIKLNAFGLPGWKWGENAKKECWCILDEVSATDANLWIAYSLYKMHEKIQDKKYKEDADKLIQAIKEHQILYNKKRPYLVPWEKNKIKKGNWRLNPSYFVFEIFEYLAKKKQDDIWTQLIQSSQRTLHKARFSSLELHSDWVIYRPSLDKYLLTNEKNYFGYDAIRIPLNILRSDLSKDEKDKLLEPYINYIKMMFQNPLGVVELEKGEISLYNLSFAHLAIYIKIAEFKGLDTKVLKSRLDEMIKKKKDDYYSYSLFLLSIVD